MSNTGIEKAARNLIAQANWAVDLLKANAEPYNRECTCQIRLVQAVGQLERALKENGLMEHHNGPPAAIP